MNSAIDWPPYLGAALTLLIGLIGFFKPRLMLDPMGVALNKPAAVSEMRAVFGGLNVGMAIAAFTLSEPLIFTAIGIAWGAATLARLYSLAMDGIGLKGAIPGIVVDGVLCGLFLAPQLAA